LVKKEHDAQMKTKDDALAAKDVELMQQSGVVSVLTAKLQSAELDATTQSQIGAETVRHMLEIQLRALAVERKNMEDKLQAMRESMDEAKVWLILHSA
jgi:hypothetical protein